MEITPYTAIHQCYRNETLANMIQENIKMVGMPEWTEEEQAFTRALQRAVGAEEKGLPDDSAIAAKPEGASPVFVGGGSSDIGEVSLVAPLSSVRFPTSVPGAIGHHWTTTAVTGSSIAHKGIVAGAQVMAVSAIELLTNPDKVTEIRKEFRTMQEEHFYNYKNDGKALILDENGNAQFESYLPYLFDRAGRYEYDPKNGKFFVPEGKEVAPPVGFLSEQMAKYRGEMAKNYRTPEWYDGPEMKME
jgi:hypothetical protein